MVGSGLLGSLLCAIGIHRWVNTEGARFCIRCGRIPKLKSKKSNRR